MCVRLTVILNDKSVSLQIAQNMLVSEEEEYDDDSCRSKNGVKIRRILNFP